MTATSAGQLTRPIADAAGPSARRLLTVLLRRYGIPVAESVTADSADSAVEAAWWLGFPVTMVAEGARLAGRPETTRCGLATPAQVRVAYRRLAASLGPSMTGVRIRRQPQQGAEVIVRFARDTEGQARVSLVLGGPAGALVGAQVNRLAPLTARDARGMLDELHGGGAEQPEPPAAASGPPTGEPAALDVGALAGLLERVSRLAAAVPQVIELELNPVIVTRCGAAVAGVRGEFRRSRDAGRGSDRTQARLRRVS